MNKQNIFQLTAAAVFVFAAPLATYASPGAGGIGTGRLLPTIAIGLAITGIIIGRLALARSRRTGNVRPWAIISAVLASVSLVISGLHIINSAGGFGTGNGRAGAILALVLGIIGMILSGLALARCRRSIRGCSNNHISNSRHS